VLRPSSQSQLRRPEAGKAGESEGGQEDECVMNQTEQLNLPGVPRAKQGREVPSRWEWTEAEVWTERMLETLERGIKGGKSKCLLRGTGANLLKSLSPSQASQSRNLKNQAGSINRRAVCGKSARTVRREGWPSGYPSPYSTESRPTLIGRSEKGFCSTDNVEEPIATPWA
jgi:hypothetical protein